MGQPLRFFLKIFKILVKGNAAVTQAQRRELLAPRGHRHHRRVGDLVAATQLERRELLTVTLLIHHRYITVTLLLPAHYGSVR